MISDVLYAIVSALNDPIDRQDCRGVLSEFNSLGRLSDLAKKELLLRVRTVDLDRKYLLLRFFLHSAFLWNK